MVVAINLHYQILSSITTDDVTEILRELLKKHIFEEQLPDYYKTIIKPRTPFVETEEQLVLASPTEGYDKFDLSLLVKVLRNLCGAEVNKNLKSLYRIRNAISHLPSTNISQQDFNRWFNELCTVAEEIEKKLEKTSRVRHLFCSFRDKVIAESIENHIALAEQDLETLASKGEDISNHELGKHLCQFQSYIQNIENKIHGRLRRLKKYAHQVGKTMRPPDDACTFMRSSGGDKTNLINTSAHKPQQTFNLSQLDRRKTPYADHVLLGQNIGQLTQTTESTCNEQNKSKTLQDTDDCSVAERRQIPTKNTEEHLRCRLSYQGVEKHEAPCIHLDNRWQCGFDGHLAKQTTQADAIDCLVRLNKSLQYSLHNSQLKPDLNQTSLSLQRNINNIESQEDTGASLVSSNNPQIPLRTVNQTSRNPNQGVKRDHAQIIPVVKRKSRQVNTDKQIVETKVNIGSGRDEKGDAHVQKYLPPVKQNDSFLKHMNDNPIVQFCVDDVTKCTQAKKDGSEERGKSQINKDNSQDGENCVTVKIKEQWKENSSKNQKDSSKCNQNKLPFEKGASTEKKPIFSKKKTTKYKGTPSKQQSHTSPFVTIPNEPMLSGSVMNEDMNKLEKYDDLPLFCYPIRLLNVNRVANRKLRYSDQIFHWCKGIAPNSIRDVAQKGTEVKSKARNCYKALGVDIRDDDGILVKDDQDDYGRFNFYCLATPDYDGDVVILHSDSKFPQDRDLAKNMLKDLKKYMDGLTGVLQEEVQIPGTRVFDVHRFFNYRRIFVLITRYYTQSPLLRHIVDIILNLSFENENGKNRLIPVLMENTSYPFEVSPIHPLEFFKTFEDGEMEHYYPEKLQKLFPHRVLRRSVSCV